MILHDIDPTADEDIARPNGGAFNAINAAQQLPPERPDAVPLDETTIALLADFARQAAKMEGLLEGQRSGALSLFIRQKGLQGNWMLADNGRELVRAQIPAAPAQ